MKGIERATPQYIRRPVGRDEVVDLDEQFDACDTDRDQRIDFREFNKLLGRLGSELPRGQRRARFDAIDSDRDGTIDRREFLDWLQRA